MKTPALFVVLFTILCFGDALAADSGTRPHALGSFDVGTGVSRVVSGGDLGPIAARFGMSLA